MVGIIAITTLPDGRRIEEGRAGWLPAVRVAMSDVRFVRLLFASVLASCLFFQFESTLPLHVVDSGFTPRVYGALISMNGLLIILDMIAEQTKEAA